MDADDRARMIAELNDVVMKDELIRSVIVVEMERVDASDFRRLTDDQLAQLHEVVAELATQLDELIVTQMADEREEAHRVVRPPQ